MRKDEAQQEGSRIGTRESTACWKTRSYGAYSIWVETI